MVAHLHALRKKHSLTREKDSVARQTPAATPDDQSSRGHFSAAAQASEERATSDEAAKRREENSSSFWRGNFHHSFPRGFSFPPSPSSPPPLAGYLAKKFPNSFIST